VASSYRSWDSAVGGLLAIALAALLFAASIIITFVRVAAFGLLTVQEFVVERGLARFAAAAGLEVDVGALPIRLLASVILWGSLIMAVYILILAGTHLSTLIVLVLVGVGLGIALTLLAAVGGAGDAGLLSSLRFWEDQ
jgi:hypothetical protein